jgi:hypothetical protein
MKSWIVCAMALSCLTATGAASACGTEEEGARRPRPVVQNVSLQANEMLERAGRLDLMASSREQQARVREREADNLESRARVLRNESTFVNVNARAEILVVADELLQRAVDDRNRAAADRSQASQLRMEARNLRERANILVRGNGGGWRKRAVADVSL